MEEKGRGVTIVVGGSSRGLKKKKKREKSDFYKTARIHVQIDFSTGTAQLWVYLLKTAERVYKSFGFTFQHGRFPFRKVNDHSRVLPSTCFNDQGYPQKK